MPEFDPNAPVGTFAATGAGAWIKKEKGWAPVLRKPRGTPQDKEMVGIQKGLAKTQLSGAKLGLAVRQAETAKMAATFLIPAILIGGFFVAGGVLWEWFATGYNWLWLLGILFVMIIMIRRMR